MNAKTKFRSVHEKQWADIADKAIFAEALAAATQTAVSGLPTATNPEQAAANGYMLEGIKRAMASLESLSQPDDVLRPAPSGNLKRP